MAKLNYNNFRRQTKKWVTPIPLQGMIKSEALAEARSDEGFSSCLQDAINESHAEAQRIINLSEELAGDPENSTGYVQAVELNHMCWLLLMLFSN